MGTKHYCPKSNARRVSDTEKTLSFPGVGCMAGIKVPWNAKMLSKLVGVSTTTLSGSRTLENQRLRRLTH